MTEIHFYSRFISFSLHKYLQVEDVSFCSVGVRSSPVRKFSLVRIIIRARYTTPEFPRVSLNTIVHNFYDDDDDDE